MQTSHYRFLDLMKAVAANLIVLHHLAFYGPMTDHLRPVLPGLLEWLEQDARIAVQVFLVIGGFLAAKSLSATHLRMLEPVKAILRRYAKLAPPFVVAMIIAIAASALASEWMMHDSISAPPTPAQLVAHAALLHGVLGFESLSAGAWYVAIDFQLYALLALMLWLAGRAGASGRLAKSMVALGTAASLFAFNLDAGLDNWAIYFFGSYGLGVLAWWASERRVQADRVLLKTILILVIGGLALDLEFRSRIAVALVTALALVALSRGLIRLPGQDLRVAAWLGKVSYGIFLMHFPVSLVINAGFFRFAPAEAEWQVVGVLVAWMASIAAGAAFHRWVEVPLAELTIPASERRKAQDSRPLA